MSKHATKQKQDNYVLSKFGDSQLSKYSSKKKRSCSVKNHVFYCSTSRRVFLNTNIINFNPWLLDMHIDILYIACPLFQIKSEIYNCQSLIFVLNVWKQLNESNLTFKRNYVYLLMSENAFNFKTKIWLIFSTTTRFVFTNVQSSWQQHHNTPGTVTKCTCCCVAMDLTTESHQHRYN